MDPRNEREGWKGNNVTTSKATRFADNFIGRIAKDVVTQMLADIDGGENLIAEYYDSGFLVWSNYGVTTSTSPYKGVTQAELDAVIEAHPDKVTIRNLPVHTGGEGCSVDAEGIVSDAGFHSEMLGDED